MKWIDGLRWMLLFSVTPAMAEVTPADLARLSPPESELTGPDLPGNTIQRSVSGMDIDVSQSELTKKAVGFSFTNIGPNRIVPKRANDVGMGLERHFSFNFTNRARQDIHLAITDIPNEYLSQMMESYFYLFPRHHLPAIEQVIGQGGKTELKVTLTTGETVNFDAESKEVLSGVFKENAPMDLGPDRFKRKFAAVEYTGDGVLLRVDRRGADPRLGTTATISMGKKTCKIPSKLLFDQREDSDVNFLFHSDAEFSDFLKLKCGFTFSP